ncbi:unnamed protein product [Cyprideis torosa]|uniref:Arsenite methyltransferase n=1 Tax=Cyprideis torosa TaxID=163714 RepID=A0A7R8WCL2_9CRUS|nr:unnamed protein product [Cyprideis torosa]CAG0893604.1 unnamed protein product [Cyprideis torosa]
MKYYGCGLPFPEAVEGCSVLDLGCGTGRDVYVLSQLVGPEGRVVGVDMTDEQLAVAREFQPWHEQKFGWKNTEFYQGYIEKLDEISALKEGDFDVIISNCVINLSLDKKAVLSHCQRLLKEGGEMYFSDIYASKPVPEALRRDKVAWGECLSGALFWRDLYAYCQELGALLDPLPVQASAIEVGDARLKNLISETCPDGLEFASVTYRIFKKTDKTTSTSALTQEVKYLGSIPGSTDTTFCLSHGRKFRKGETVSVTYELAEVLRMSRYKSHFEFLGDSGSPINPFTILEKTGGSCGSGSPEQEKKFSADNIPIHCIIHVRNTPLHWKFSVSACHEPRSLTPITCARCNLSFCLKHRHPCDHKCTAVSQQQSILQAKNDASVAFLARIQARFSDKRDKGCGGSKNPATAQKVALMRLKQRAKLGQTGVAEEEKFFLEILPPARFADSGRAAVPIIMSKLSTIGKVIDVAADVLDVPNENNREGAKMLRLFNAQGQAMSEGESLECLLEKAALVNGGSLLLEYAEE